MNLINIFCPTIGVGGVEKNLYIISNFLVKKNPFGGPIEIKLNDYYLAIRKEDALLIYTSN